jgi:hypothetical protein
MLPPLTAGFQLVGLCQKQEALGSASGMFERRNSFNPAMIE